ncbi:MAG: fibronectin type III-like domain-contianing protein, partial [Blastomonas fulva]
YMGQQGGHAMAAALFGDVNPGGKLPVTVARHVGQVPVFYDAKPSARRGYLFDTTDPLFPFGHGLSYTRFELSAPRLSTSRIGPGAGVTVSVDVANVGDREGDEVVQLYIRDQVASVTQPIKVLKGFQRVTLKPGERRTVAIVLEPDAFAIWNDQMREVVEPGLFDIMTGPDSRNIQTVTLEIA